MGQTAPALGIDFGTSNSAAAWVAADGLARALPLEGDATTLPTAVFFNTEDHSTHFGREAMALYLAGVEGRLMRSLKSVLGSTLMQETTAIGDQLVRFQDVVAIFLDEVARRAQALLGARPRRVVLGRPVHFVDDDAARDRLAEDSLRAAASTAGFTEIAFQFEPIAAAFDYERRIARESLVLVADIGGGTSDFTVVRLAPGHDVGADRTRDVLATRGVHIGGTDFDQRLNLARVMTALGLRHRGPDGREVPSKVFFELSSWHLIHWLSSPKAQRDARGLRVNYSDTQLHDRLMRVLAEGQGHHIAQVVEQGKIDVSVRNADSVLDLSFVDPAMQIPLTPAQLAQELADALQRVLDCARDCVSAAGLAPAQLDAIYLTGGSSALRTFQQVVRDGFPGVPLVEGDLFGGVAAGLAYAAQARFGG
ncbi:Hsp70 family protein [Pseudorhodoferax sp. Leaf267]|uniref:Hsp70 family protein n=1 Tax=Pseudorhodoferax sp. Leaf267 TaxID=1736316 RepID=UPI00070004C5|nr:Hsp70 family protein [Pseudorhodoferax sp. Leaf267]KQP14318.1 heat-shock protein [Pseudorhodoferax sp. Leaf267]